ncbi:MAG: tetratricopeptide repeat protein, partial [Solirubrobacteraceae bacterium]
MRWPWGTEPVERAPAAKQGPLDGRPAFIGRTDEQDAFRRLLAEVAAGSSAFVHLSGTARSGRRALLDQFRALAAESSAGASPLIDLEADAGLELDQILERLAGGLEPEPEHFKGFFDATKRLRSREAGLPTRTSQAVAAVRAGSTAVTQLAGALPVKAVNAAIQSPLGDILTEHAETRRTLSAVSEEFVGGLLSLAEARGPLLLVFSDVDFAASSAKLLWLRRSLFPRIARARLIVAVSSEPQFELEDVGMLFGSTAQIQLDRFKESEAAQFLELHIGVDKDSPLGRAVLEDSDRFPERLAGYAQYFREHPEARQSDRLPMEARDLTAGGLASGLLSRISDPFLRDVVLHAAPLRWFNAELLNGIEGVCGLAPADGGRHAAGLLELGLRPSWVTNLGGGWGIDVDTRRRAIVDEFRRLHPGLYRRVHLHAARYHLDRLRELEGAPPAATGAPGTVDEAAAFDYQPATHPTDRLRWSDYQAALGEWLYHLVALSPRHGFARLADYVGEALAWGSPAQATALLEIGVEITLPASEALTRQRLLEVARAMHHDRHADTLQLLDEFAAAGSASTIADAGAFFLVGTRLVLLGRSPLTVHANFERAEKLLAGAGAVDGGVQARSLRCLNLTRLARELARRDKGGEAALNMLTTAAGLAETCDPRMQAEVRRTRGLILAGLARLDEALAACDEALEPLNRIGAAAEAALILGLRADVNLTSGRPAAARRDLLRARSIYRQLVDPEAEAQVLVGLLDIAIRGGDDKAAAEQEQAIALLRPEDLLLRNQIGIVYFRAGRQPEAVDRYTAALAGGPEPAIYANRGRALVKWAIEVGAVAVAGRAAAEAADRAEEPRGRDRGETTAEFQG